MDKREKPVVVDPAYRAAKFIQIIKAHGMRSNYEFILKRPLETKRVLT